MFFCTSAFAGVLPLFNPESVVDNQNSLYFKSDILLLNDSMSLHGLFSGFKGDLHHKSGKNVALGDGRVDVGYMHKNFGYIGYTYREEIFMDASEDAVSLVYLVTNKKDLPIGKKYQLELNINAFKVQGITYANKWKIYNHDGWKVSFGGGVELLSAMEGQDGNVQGDAVARSQQNYDFYATSEYHYTHNYLYDLDVKKAHAYGYTTHLSLLLQKDKVKILLLANDFIGKLYWKDFAYSDVHLSSANKYYNSQGYVRYRPTLSGYEGYENYTQTMLQKFRVMGEYKFSYRNSLVLGSDMIDKVYLPYIHYAHRFEKNFKIDFGYETRFQSVNIGFHYKGYALTVRSDDLFQPRTLGIGL